MKITFYGVRGSIPVPRTEMMRFGGNTACVHIALHSGIHLVLDAGTGIRELGKHLRLAKEPIYIFLSHSHWDHVIGYPFFAPIYQKGRDICIFPSRRHGHGQLCSLLDQMDGAHFPISSTQLPSNTRCLVDDAESALQQHGLTITRKILNHPGGGYAYRALENNNSCAYVTDNELPAPREDSTNYAEWVTFCRGVDVLIHDAQYLDSEMPERQGWGHSALSRVWQLALDAKVKTLVLFHHDPERTDAQIQAIQDETQTFFQKKHSNIKAVCAFEGLSINL